MILSSSSIALMWLLHIRMKLVFLVNLTAVHEAQ